MTAYFRFDSQGREEARLPIVLYGNGPQARVAHAFIAAHAEVAAFAVDDHLIDPGAQTLAGLPVIPLSRLRQAFPPSGFAAIVAVGYRGMNGLRQQKARELADLGYRLASYVDPTAKLSLNVEVENNCIVLDHVSLHPDARIGEGTFISSGAVLGHDCLIAPYCWIGSGCALAGAVRVGERSFFGLQAGVADKVTIGERCFIGSHAFVSQELPPRSTIVARAGEILPIDSERFMAIMA